MADIGALVVRITADASSLSKELDNISKGGSKAAAAIQRASQIMLAGLAATATALAFATQKAGQYAEELENLSLVTGMSTDKLQQYEAVMAEVGATGADFSSMMRRLSVSLEQARQGTGDAALRFRQLGIDINKIRDTEQLFRVVADAQGKFANGTEKLAILSDLLGKGVEKYLPLLNRGSKAFDEVAKSSEIANASLTAFQVQGLAKADDQLDKTGKAFQRFSNQLGALFTGAAQSSAMEKFFNWMAAKLREFDTWLDIIIIKFQHWILMAGEIADMKIKDFFDSSMMDALADRLAIINREMDKQVALRRMLGGEMYGPPKPTPEQLGTIKPPPSLTDVGKGMKAAPFVLSGPEAIKGMAIVERTKAIQENQLRIEKEQTAELLRKLELGEQYEMTFEQMDKQEKEGAAATAKGIKDYEKRFFVLENEAELRKDIHEEQMLNYQQDFDFSDKAAAARRTALEAIDAQAALTTAKLKEQLDQQLIDEEQHAEQIERLRRRTENQKKAVAAEFPGFWAKQLDDIARSNVFAMGSLVSTWSNAIATMIVKGGDLKAAWEATKIAVVQAFIQMGVAGAANAAKTLLMNEAAAGGVTAIWSGVGAFITGLWATVTGALASMFATLVGIMTAVGEAIMGVLTAIAEALIDTVFGSAWGVAILAGVIAIGVALGALAAVGVFAEGGVVTGPMLGLVGEAGPEAIIPLDRMKDFGGGAERQTVVQLSIDGKKFMRAVARHTGSAWRSEGAPA